MTLSSRSELAAPPPTRFWIRRRGLQAALVMSGAVKTSAAPVDGPMLVYTHLAACCDLRRVPVGYDTPEAALATQIHTMMMMGGRGFEPL